MSRASSIFEDAEKARAWLESKLWADGPVCSHCTSVNTATPIRSRAGLYQCNTCRKQFTVTVGTPLERSHIPLNKWLLAAHLSASATEPVSPYQMHLALGVSYKTALLMLRRLDEARRTGKLPLPDGSGLA